MLNAAPSQLVGSRCFDHQLAPASPSPSSRLAPPTGQLPATLNSKRTRRRVPTGGGARGEQTVASVLQRQRDPATHHTQTSSSSDPATQGSQQQAGTPTSKHSQMQPSTSSSMRTSDLGASSDAVCDDSSSEPEETVHAQSSTSKKGNGAGSHGVSILSQIWPSYGNSSSPGGWVLPPAAYDLTISKAHAPASSSSEPQPPVPASAHMQQQDGSGQQAQGDLQQQQQQQQQGMQVGNGSSNAVLDGMERQLDAPLRSQTALQTGSSLQQQQQQQQQQSWGIPGLLGSHRSLNQDVQATNSTSSSSSLDVTPPPPNSSTDATSQQALSEEEIQRQLQLRRRRLRNRNKGWQGGGVAYRHDRPLGEGGPTAAEVQADQEAAAQESLATLVSAIRAGPNPRAQSQPLWSLLPTSKRTSARTNPPQQPTQLDPRVRELMDDLAAARAQHGTASWVWGPPLQPPLPQQQQQQQQPAPVRSDAEQLTRAAPSVATLQQQQQQQQQQQDQQRGQRQKRREQPDSIQASASALAALLLNGQPTPSPTPNLSQTSQQQSQQQRSSTSSSGSPAVPARVRRAMREALQVQRRRESSPSGTARTAADAPRMLAPLQVLARARALATAASTRAGEARPPRSLSTPPAPSDTTSTPPADPSSAHSPSRQGSSPVAPAPQFSTPSTTPTSSSRSMPGGEPPVMGSTQPDRSSLASNNSSRSTDSSSSSGSAAVLLTSALAQSVLASARAQLQGRSSSAPTDQAAQQQQQQSHSAAVPHSGLAVGDEGPSRVSTGSQPKEQLDALLATAMVNAGTPGQCGWREVVGLIAEFGVYAGPHTLATMLDAVSRTAPLQATRDKAQLQLPQQQQQTQQWQQQQQQTQQQRRTSFPQQPQQRQQSPQMQLTVQARREAEAAAWLPHSPSLSQQQQQQQQRSGGWPPLGGDADVGAVSPSLDYRSISSVDEESSTGISSSSLERGSSDSSGTRGRATAEGAQQGGGRVGRSWQSGDAQQQMGAGVRPGDNPEGMRSRGVLLKLLRLLPPALPHARLPAVTLCLRAVTVARQRRLVASRRLWVQLVPLLLDRVQALLPSASAPELVLTLRVLVRMELGPMLLKPGLCKLVQDRVAQLMQGSDPLGCPPPTAAQLLQVGWCLARLACTPKKTWQQSFAGAMVNAVPEMYPVELVLLSLPLVLWSQGSATQVAMLQYGRGQRPPTPQGQVHQQPQDQQQLAGQRKKWEWPPQDLLDAMGEAALSLIPPSSVVAQHALTTQLPQPLLSGQPGAPRYKQILQQVQQMQGAQANGHHEQLVQGGQARERQKWLGPYSLATLCTRLAQCGWRPRRGWVQQLTVATVPLLPTSSARDLSLLLGSLAAFCQQPHSPPSATQNSPHHYGDNGSTVRPSKATQTSPYQHGGNGSTAHTTSATVTVAQSEPGCLPGLEFLTRMALAFLEHLLLGLQHTSTSPNAAPQASAPSPSGNDTDTRAQDPQDPDFALAVSRFMGALAWLSRALLAGLAASVESVADQGTRGRSSVAAPPPSSSSSSAPAAAAPAATAATAANLGAASGPAKGGAGGEGGSLAVDNVQGIVQGTEEARETSRGTTEKSSFNSSSSNSSSPSSNPCSSPSSSSSSSNSSSGSQQRRGVLWEQQQAAELREAVWLLCRGCCMQPGLARKMHASTAIQFLCALLVLTAVFQLPPPPRSVLDAYEGALVEKSALVPPESWQRVQSAYQAAGVACGPGLRLELLKYL